jgi:hypothetical protein
VATRDAPPTQPVAAEAARRRELWQALLRSGGPVGVPPHVLRRLGLYAGQQGIYVDKPRTAPLNGGIGAALSLLHKGFRYADDLSEDDQVFRRVADGDGNDEDAEAAE